MVGSKQVNRTDLKGSLVLTQPLDGSWAVVYNPKLTRKFLDHLNVELCISGVGGIKQFFKYSCKG